MGGCASRSKENPVNPAQDRKSISYWAAQIDQYIFLGSMEAAECDLMSFRRHNIGSVLVLGPDLPMPYVKHLRYLHVPAEDHGDWPLISYFGPCIRFINASVQRKEAVLVHCSAGFSRSPTVVAAWLMNRYAINHLEALARIRHKRAVSPNAGFLAQLELFSKLDANPELLDLDFRPSQVSVTQSSYPVSASSASSASCNSGASSSSSIGQSLHITYLGFAEDGIFISPTTPQSPMSTEQSSPRAQCLATEKAV